jgi:hypothetical protein
MRSCKRKNPVVRGAESGLRATKDHLISASRTLRIAFRAIEDEGGTPKEVYGQIIRADNHIAMAQSLINRIKRVDNVYP